MHSEPAPIIRALLSAAQNCGSLSDELHFAGTDWPTRYHVDHGRSNILRAFDLPPTARTLHIGAETGALTRYLAERVATVDAIEISSTQAEIAELRTRDLANVRIVRSPDDLPDGATYDVIVAIDVLKNPRQAHDVLSLTRERLSPQGTLLLSVDNQFSVRNLAGAPDLHTGRRWDAPEGYPFTSSASAYSEKKLRNLLTGNGFHHLRIFGCFPDLLFTRVVLSSELVADYPQLAIDLPRLPSTDYGHDSPRPADEAALWREFVTAGLGVRAWNSFIVVAGIHDVDKTVWPPTRLGMYFNTDRAAPWCSAAEVQTAPHGAEIHRKPLINHPGRGEVFSQSWTDPVYQGKTMVKSIVDEPWLTENLLLSWKQLVATSNDNLATALWDLVPHNIMVTDDGLKPIDLEWHYAHANSASVIERGALLVAEQLAAAAWRGAGTSSTVYDLARWLGRLIDLDTAFVDRAVRREARFQALQVCGLKPVESVVQEHERGFIQAWQTRLDEQVPEPCPMIDLTDTPFRHANVGDN